MGLPHRSAFTLVEALVATAVIGVAGAALAAALGSSAALRVRAEADARAAQLFRERIATLAARACAAPDTAGASPPERWHARRSASGWAYADTVDDARAPHQGARPASIEGVVACAR